MQSGERSSNDESFDGADALLRAPTDIGRLRWRCRRGTRELDRLLEAWLRESFPQADAAARSAFEEMLDVPDPDLWNWLTGQGAPADQRFVRIVDEIRARHCV
jgi:antitoxin CptB